MTPSARALLRIYDERIARQQAEADAARAAELYIEAAVHQGWADATGQAREEAVGFLAAAEIEAALAILDDPEVRAEMAVA